MKVDHNDFRQRFAELSDVGLLSINRDKLVDVAHQCYDLEVAHRGLQSEPDVREEPEAFPKLVGVLDTNDNFALASAGTAFHEAGIIYDIVPIPDLPGNLKAENPKWWIRPCRVLVSAEDEGEARDLVEPFQHPLPNSDVQEDLEQDRS